MAFGKNCRIVFQFPALPEFMTIDDVANSSISVAGTAVSSGAASYINTLGVDVDRFELGTVDGALEVVAGSNDDDVLLGAVIAVLVH